MFGLDYIDAAIFAALGATGCFRYCCTAMTPGKITIVGSPTSRI